MYVLGNTHPKHNEPRWSKYCRDDHDKKSHLRFENALIPSRRELAKYIIQIAAEVCTEDVSDQWSDIRQSQLTDGEVVW